MITIKNFLDCPEELPMVAERIHTQWVANKTGHTADGMLQRMSKGCRWEIPIGLVAFCDGVPAGTVSLVVNDLEERKDLRPWLAGLLVFPDFRARGVGSALTKELMEIGGSIRAASMYLYTDKPRFYEKLGWTQLFETSSDPGSVVMSYLTNPRLR